MILNLNNKKMMKFSLRKEKGFFYIKLPFIYSKFNKEIYTKAVKLTVESYINFPTTDNSFVFSEN